jgi:hypothetical protein
MDSSATPKPELMESNIPGDIKEAITSVESSAPLKLPVPTFCLLFTTMIKWELSHKKLSIYHKINSNGKQI